MGGSSQSNSCQCVLHFIFDLIVLLDQLLVMLGSYTYCVHCLTTEFILQVCILINLCMTTLLTFCTAQQSV